MNDIKKPREISRRRSVDSLQRLYTTVISLSIASILIAFIENISGKPLNEVLIQSSILISFFVTIIPFYHGANRYLDATYVTQERHAKDYALMIDFIALFIEGILFFVLSRLTNSGDWFFIVFLFLLAFDIVWVGITNITVNVQTESSRLYLKWVLVNLIFFVLLTASFFTNWFRDLVDGNRSTIIAAETLKYLIAVILLTARSIFDYRLVWHFYYPNLNIEYEDIHGRHEGAKKNPIVEEIKKNEKDDGKIDISKRHKKNKGIGSLSKYKESSES